MGYGQVVYINGWAHGLHVEGAVLAEPRACDNVSMPDSVRVTGRKCLRLYDRISKFSNLRVDTITSKLIVKVIR